jgi:hypothetical protein
MNWYPTMNVQLMVHEAVTWNFYEAVQCPGIPDYVL